MLLTTVAIDNPKGECPGRFFGPHEWHPFFDELDGTEYRLCRYCGGREPTVTTHQLLSAIKDPGRVTARGPKRPPETVADRTG